MNREIIKLSAEEMKQLLQTIDPIAEDMEVLADAEVIEYESE